MIPQQLVDPLRRLVRDQAAADLGLGLAGDDCLEALPGETAPHAVDLQGGPGAGPLHRGELRLAVERGDARLGQGLLLAVGHLGQQLPLLGREGAHVVVEAGHGDPPLLVVEGGQELGQGLVGVVDDAAEAAAVQVAPGACHRELPGPEPPQPVDDHRLGGGEDVAVRDQADVRGQLLLELGEHLGQVGAAHLLLALHDELHVHRQAAFRGQQGLHRLHMDEDLALVVRCSPGIDVRTLGPLLDRGLEGGRLPQLQGIHGLDIVVAVDEHRGRVRPGVEPVRVDQGVPLGGDEGHVLQADGLHVIRQPAGRAEHVLLVLGQGADAGDAQPLLELLQLGLFGFLQVALDGFPVHVSSSVVGRDLGLELGPTPVRFCRHYKPKQSNVNLAGLFFRSRPGPARHKAIRMTRRLRFLYESAASVRFLAPGHCWAGFLCVYWQCGHPNCPLSRGPFLAFHFVCPPEMA